MGRYSIVVGMCSSVLHIFGVVFGFLRNFIQLKSLLSIFMLPGHMQTEGIFTFEYTFTMFTIVTEVSGEMGAFNVVPHIVSM